MLPGYDVAVNNTPQFWISLAVFQLAFGLAIFAITRQAYLPDSTNSKGVPAALGQPSTEWTDRITEISPALALSTTPNQVALNDPVEISRQADQYFASQQYALAAGLYEKLVEIAPNNVDALNNLGITLHYLGRSGEALDWLRAGAALEPANQRIWLTLGFVNSQLGNIDEARAALTTAAEMGATTDVGQSAKRMLEDLQ